MDEFDNKNGFHIKRYTNEKKFNFKTYLDNLDTLHSMDISNLVDDDYNYVCEILKKYMDRIEDSEGFQENKRNYVLKHYIIPIMMKMCDKRSKKKKLTAQDKFYIETWFDL